MNLIANYKYASFCKIKKIYKQKRTNQMKNFDLSAMRGAKR